LHSRDALFRPSRLPLLPRRPLRPELPQHLGHDFRRRRVRCLPCPATVEQQGRTGCRAAPALLGQRRSAQSEP
jgi:hypothetical protein